MASYRDPRIRADDRELALRWYYFPLGTRRIRWDEIAEVREHDMGTGLRGGRWRIWGSGDLVHWMPLDLRRPRKRTMFVLHLRRTSVRPCVTPDDPDAFRALLADRGVRVTALDPPYRD